MDHRLIEGLMTAIAPVIKDALTLAIEKATAPLATRIAELAARPSLKGEDGKSVTLDDVAPLIAGEIAKAVEALPRPLDGKDGRDGVDGKDGAGVTVDDVTPLVVAEVTKAVEALPRPLDGKDGRDGVDGKDGLPGLNGNDAEPATIKLMVAEEVAKIPPASDGKSLAADDLKPLLQEMIDALPKPPKSFLIDESGDMLGVYSDGSTKTLGRARGRDGEHGKTADVPLAPDDVADQVARAIALIAESPRLDGKSAAQSPFVLNILPPAAEHRPKNKTITTRKDEHGNMVADVIEHEGSD